MLKVISKEPNERNNFAKDSTKYLVLRNLKSAVKKLKAARAELHWSVIEAIEMGAEADDIAEDVFLAVIEAFKEDWMIKDSDIPK